ncbi:Ribonuclease J1 [bioreactor metagenome]|uniref:Ribonuclease J1 n=1 Tax=bioreactor metagenome TaxID=1076179 RepID=A0A644T5Z7_9ZZZZ|nr:ribonuclease J [Candidatus Elulimicrobiales bacterium]
MNTNNKPLNKNTRKNNTRPPKSSGPKSSRSSYAGMSRRPSSRPPIRNKKNAGLKFETKISEGTELAHIPPLASDSIRIINLGGVEEIGRNMSCIEYKDSIIVVDCGFQFSESTTPGIECILPNTRYLEENKHKIKGLLITHGHLDHIGAIPYILPRIGNPKVYARQFTALMIKKRHEEFPQLDPLNLEIIETEDTVELGDLRAKFFAVSHAIPDSMGLIIETPYGDIVHTGDLRLDHDDGIPTPSELERYEIFKGRKVLCLLTDSTNCENPGFSISDRVVFENIRKIIRDAKGRLIIATFSSQVERMLEIMKMIESYGKKIAVEGRSIKTNIEVAKLAGLLKVDPKIIIPIEDIENYPRDRVVILATGAQGEEFAVLNRTANGTHKYIKLDKNTTILMSSSIVPGNERAVQMLKDKLSRKGAHIIHYKTSDVHSSGHANHDELVWIHSKIAPKFFIPVHGYHYMLRVHADIQRELGMPEENIIIPDNGMIIEIQNAGEKIVALKEFAPNEMIIVDGMTVGKIQDVVMRDRQTLAEDGMFVAIGVIDNHTKKLKKSPDLISRGFVYLKESQELLYQTRSLAKKIIEENLEKNTNVGMDDIKNELSEALAKFLLQKTAKRPVIIPVIIVV